MSGAFAAQVGIPPWADGRLEDATVIIVGVGGLGSLVAVQLAQSGVGRLVLCDPDVVEKSNLNRGALFTRKDADLNKAEVAKQALGAITPDTDVDARPDDFRYAIGMGELRRVDLVVSCLDSVADRIALSSRCMLSGNPRGLLDAGLHPWGGEVRHYRPGGPCYACGCIPFERALPASHQACGLPGPAGASAPVTAAVAALQATYALRLLFDESLPEETLRFDAETGDTRRFPPRRDPDCPCHDVIDRNYITLTTLTNQSTLAQLMALAGDGEHVQAWYPTNRGDPLSPLALRTADPQAQLRELGIPPAEIIPVVRVRPQHHVRYLALREA